MLAAGSHLHTRCANVKIAKVKAAHQAEEATSSMFMADGSNVDHVHRSNLRHYDSKTAFLDSSWPNRLRLGLMLVTSAASLPGATRSCWLAEGWLKSVRGVCTMALPKSTGRTL